VSVFVSRGFAAGRRHRKSSSRNELALEKADHPEWLVRLFSFPGIIESTLSIRILGVLPQFPFDPTSNDPGEFLGTLAALQSAGFEIRLLANTATRHLDRLKPATRLERSRVRFQILPAKSAGRLRPEFHADRFQISMRIVDVGNRTVRQWETIHAQAFDHALENEIRGFAPDVILSAALSANDRKRMARARRKGVRVIDYPVVDDPLDASTSENEQNPQLPVHSLGIPVIAENVIAEHAEPLCVTYTDPSVDTGVLLAIPLLDQLGIDRPDQPLLILSSRISAENLGHRMIRTAAASGIDLRRHESILLAEPAAVPWEVWAPTRILILPTLKPAPMGIVAGALRNGIPILASDRAGISHLPGVTTVSLPLEYTADTKAVLPASATEGWMDALADLLDDDDAYDRKSREARQAGAAWAPEALAARYAESLLGLLREA
jgi:hypothetical protein